MPYEYRVAEQLKVGQSGVIGNRGAAANGPFQQRERNDRGRGRHQDRDHQNFYFQDQPTP